MRLRGAVVSPFEVANRMAEFPLRWNHAELAVRLAMEDRDKMIAMIGRWDYLPQ